MITVNRKCLKEFGVLGNVPAKNTIVMLAAALFLGLQAKAGVGHSQVSGTADEIVLERSSGGVGPFYTVSVRKDGRVTWYGQANVRVKGRAHARIEKGAAEKLFEMARAMNFFSAQEVRGRDCIPDSGEVRVTVREMQ